MTVSTEVARDEMLSQFLTAWNLETPAVYGKIPYVSWQAVEDVNKTGNRKPRTDEPWARVTIHHNISPQRTFGQVGNRRFERIGILTVQIFSPLGVEQSVTLGENLAFIARDAYEGKETLSGVWFRNTRIQEIGPSEPWWQLNVITEFTYDELK